MINQLISVIMIDTKTSVNTSHGKRFFIYKNNDVINSTASFWLHRLLVINLLDLEVKAITCGGVVCGEFVRFSFQVLSLGVSQIAYSLCSQTDKVVQHMSNNRLIFGRLL